MTARLTAGSAAPEAPIPPDERDPLSPAAGRTPTEARHAIAAMTAAADTLTRVLDSPALDPTFARAVQRERDRLEADAFELQVALRTATSQARDIMALLPTVPLHHGPALAVPVVGCAGCGTEVRDDDAEAVPGLGLCCARCAELARRAP